MFRSNRVSSRLPLSPHTHAITPYTGAKLVRNVRRRFAGSVAAAALGAAFLLCCKGMRTAAQRGWRHCACRFSRASVPSGREEGGCVPRCVRTCFSRLSCCFRALNLNGWFRAAASPRRALSSHQRAWRLLALPPHWRRTNMAATGGSIGRSADLFAHSACMPIALAVGGGHVVKAWNAWTPQHPRLCHLAGETNSALPWRGITSCRPVWFPLAPSRGAVRAPGNGARSRHCGTGVAKLARISLVAWRHSISGLKQKTRWSSGVALQLPLLPSGSVLNNSWFSL